MKTFNVEGYGIVTRDNAVFLQHCTEASIVDALKIGEKGRVIFRSGMGAFLAWVERIG